MNKKLLLVMGIFMVTAAVAGEDAWVIRFRADFMYSRPPCYRAQWLDELLFHNLTANDEVVTLLSATPGAIAGSATLVVPAGRTRSTNVFKGFDFGGAPLGSGIVVDHLDVPSGVTIASRAGVFGPNLPGACPVISADNFDFGSLPMRVFRQLLPENQPQVQMAADLGVNERHTNVIVYNGGSAAATATVEYRAACDEHLIESRTVVLQPNTVGQLGGFTDPVEESCSTDLASNTTRYVVVTMDQPGFSHVMTVSNEFPTPTIGVTSASGP